MAAYPERKVGTKTLIKDLAHITPSLRTKSPLFQMLKYLPHTVILRQYY